MKPAKCYLCCLGRRLGLEQKGAETLADHWQRRVWRWGINFTRISASFNFINQSQNYNIALDVVLKFNHVCVLLRCDGRRLQRDQGGGQVYQKWCYSAGFHRRGLCHDVRSFSYCSDTLLLNNNLIISSTLTLFFFLLRLLCSIQTTEAHQPGAVARGNCRGEGQSLHRHRVHGQGKKMGNYSSNVLKLILLITSDLSLSRYLDDETVLFVATSKFEHAVKSRTYLF